MLSIKGKEFYANLIKFVTSGPVVKMLLEGENIIPKVREIIGATDPAKAALGTIRGDLKEVPVKSVTEKYGSCLRFRRIRKKRN